MDRYVITASLKEIRSGTRSQWRLISAGVMCSDRRILKISRAAAFWIDGKQATTVGQSARALVW